MEDLQAENGIFHHDIRAASLHFTLLNANDNNVIDDLLY